MFESIKNRNRDALRTYRRKMKSKPSARQQKNIKKWEVKRNRRIMNNILKPSKF